MKSVRECFISIGRFLAVLFVKTRMRYKVAHCCFGALGCHCFSVLTSSRSPHKYIETIGIAVTSLRSSLVLSRRGNGIRMTARGFVFNRGVSNALTAMTKLFRPSVLSFSFSQNKTVKLQVNMSESVETEFQININGEGGHVLKQ